jgi:hypothetical protein
MCPYIHLKVTQLYKSHTLTHMYLRPYKYDIYRYEKRYDN